jgi:hypothetical protein
MVKRSDKTKTGEGGKGKKGKTVSDEEWWRGVTKRTRERVGKAKRARLSRMRKTVSDEESFRGCSY